MSFIAVGIGVSLVGSALGAHSANKAKKAAKWLMTKAADAELGGSTIRVYKGKNNFEEVEGFTVWGSYWSNNEGGTISPQA